MDVDRYLQRLGLETRPPTDLDGLTALQYAHLVAVPFENLDIALGDGVPHDVDAAVEKIVDRRRGGWCFELNGAFARLLSTLGFEVRLLGCAVLLDGPSTALEHVALEVSGGDGDLEPHLVDVGFGDHATRPLALNHAGAQDGGTNPFEFVPSPQGTTLAEHTADGLAARLRFKRVSHDFADFAPVAEAMQVDPDRRWRTHPFASRLLGTGTDRVTVVHDALKIRRDGSWTSEPIDGTAAFRSTVADWFDITLP